MGKILVCNALITSQFVFRLQVLPTLPTSLSKEIKGLIRKFIWEGKSAKIAYNRLIKSYEEGGLQLQDIINKDWAFKANWLLKWDTLDPFLQGLARKLFPAGLRKILANANYDPKVFNLSIKDLQNLTAINPDQNNVWYDSLVAWAKINHCSPQSKSNIMEQTLLYNSWLKQGNQVFDSKKLMNESDYCMIKDLVNPLGSLCSYEELAAKFPKIDFLLYNSIKLAIPKIWLKIISSKLLTPEALNGMQRINKIRKTTKASSGTKLIYKVLLENITIDNTKNKAKWEDELHCEIRDDYWEKITRCTFRLTLCTKLRSFQYRLNNRILVTNVLRHKWDTRVLHRVQTHTNNDNVQWLQ